MGKSSINGPFSMAMLNNQRVYIYMYYINYIYIIYIYIYVLYKLYIHYIYIYMYYINYIYIIYIHSIICIYIISTSRHLAET